jgi:hypothetical protein
MTDLSLCKEDDNSINLLVIWNFSSKVIIFVNIEVTQFCILIQLHKFNAIIDVMN